MANRAKRLEKELILLKVENQFKGWLKKEKVKRKEGLRPGLILLANATSNADFVNTPSKRALENMFYIMEKLKIKDEGAYQIFLQVLRYARPLFKHITVYKNFLAVLFELEVFKSFKTWIPPKSKDEVVVFKSLFYHLFVKYKIPVSLDSILKRYCYNFDYENKLEFRLLNHMVKGGGLHQFSDLPIKVNSKVNNLFFNTPTQHNVMQSIWWAAIRSKKVDASLASKIVHNIKNISSHAAWFDWLDDLIFFLNRFKDISQNDLKKILDFFILQKQGCFYIDSSEVDDSIEVLPLYPDFKLKGRSVASVLRFHEEWKNYLDMIKGIGKRKDFKSSEIKSFRIYHGKTLITIKQIKNVKELFKEGKKMSHCVGTYAGKCADNSSSIWTMKQHLPNKKVEKFLTIEILEKEKIINEALGKSNRAATDLENKWLKAWAEKEQLKCAWM